MEEPTPDVNPPITATITVGNHTHSITIPFETFIDDDAWLAITGDGVVLEATMHLDGDTEPELTAAWWASLAAEQIEAEGNVLVNEEGFELNEIEQEMDMVEDVTEMDVAQDVPAEEPAPIEQLDDVTAYSPAQQAFVAINHTQYAYLDELRIKTLCGLFLKEIRSNLVAPNTAFRDGSGVAAKTRTAVADVIRLRGTADDAWGVFPGNYEKLTELDFQSGGLNDAKHRLLFPSKMNCALTQFEVMIGMLIHTGYIYPLGKEHESYAYLIRKLTDSEFEYLPSFRAIDLFDTKFAEFNAYGDMQFANEWAVFAVMCNNHNKLEYDRITGYLSAREEFLTKRIADLETKPIDVVEIRNPYGWS